MPIFEARVKVGISSSWVTSRKVSWRDAIAQIESDRIVVKYLKMGEVVGEDSFPFSALIDLGLESQTSLN